MPHPFRCRSLDVMALSGLLAGIAAAGFAHSSAEDRNAGRSPIPAATSDRSISRTPTSANDVPLRIAIYDRDPRHLWNRLHRTLWVRTAADGKEYGQDRLDPLLWLYSKHILIGKSHERAVGVLDEFLTQHGEKLIADPLKRAILQRDLWAVFDWTTEPGETGAESRQPQPSRALQERLARIIQRLALSAEQIKRLPDNYAAAVAAKAFAEHYDAGQPDRPFLPPDLFQKDSPWVEVEIDNGSAVTASRHSFDFGARSAFRVFLRFPEGRRATVAYFDRLADVPRPWLLTREPGSTKKTLTLNPKLPQFPAGTQAALVRQMLLIDDEGRIATTNVTESVQLRVFRTVRPLGTERDTFRDQSFCEFTRSRPLLFANQRGGLEPMGPNDMDFHTQLLTAPYDEFDEAGGDGVERSMGRRIESCLGCHDLPGIHAFRSYTGGAFPRGQYYLPRLQPCDDAGREGTLTAILKRQQFSWGLLQGLWEDRPRN